MKIVGIVSNETIIRDGIFVGAKRTYLNTDYIDMVLKAGGIPIALPLITEEDILKEIISKIDGIIITGGDDINPLIYNEGPLPLLGEVSDSRDESDMKILDLAIKQGKGVLGICRGCQIINVYYGGNLYQDISYIRSNNIYKHFQKNSRWKPSHGIKILKDSFLYEALGENGAVNSFHHQSIKELGKTLKVTAISDDGIIEGIESETEKLLIGIQWHPEMMKESQCMIDLFKMFISNL